MTSKKRLVRLTRRAIAGDKRAFEELMREKSKDIYYIALGIMRNQHDGEDAAHEAILSISQKLSTLQSPEAFNTWMYKITYNVCMDLKRKMKRVAADSATVEQYESATPEEREEFLPSSFVESEESKRELLQAMQALPDTYRMCLMLYYYQDMSYAQIAEVLELNPQTVASHMRRGKKQLQALLGQPYSDESESKKPLGAFAGVPVLAYVLRDDAGKVFTPGVRDRLAATIHGEAVAPQQANSNPSTNNVSNATQAATKAAGSTAKGLVVAAVAATVVVAAVGGYLLSNRGDDSQTPPPSQATSDAPNAVNTPTPANDPENPLDKDAASKLVDYQNKGTGESKWNSFAKENGIMFRSRYITPEHSYVVSSLEKNGSFLVTITKHDADQNITVASRILSRNEGVPKGRDVVSVFDAWRKQR